MSIFYRAVTNPSYHPITVPVTYQGKLILVLWCPGGSERPYQAPEHLGKSVLYRPYIRRNSSTVCARTEDERRLHELANQVPFDDRINHHALLKDLDLGLIKSFLSEIKSDLFNETNTIPFESLCQQMQISRGPAEYIRPVNVGLLMFSQNPEKFFPCARIEVVEFHDEVGDRFSEKIFKGPIHQQLREALRYIESTFLREEVSKRPDRPEADRFFNYPYTALEEALANAVYHRDYAIREPIEVSVHPDRIEILSFPGPMPPLKIDDINKGHIRVRSYRNRRVGDFLKELHLTEGRCTGIPKIKKSMDVNGSPPPIFQTDKEELSFLTVLPVHPQATQNIGRKILKHAEEKPETHRLPGVFPAQTHRVAGVFEMDTLPEDIKDILTKLSKRPSTEVLRKTIKVLCFWKPLTAQDLAIILDRKDKKHLVRTYLTPMVNAGELKYVYPNEPDFPKQAYTGA